MAKVTSPLFSFTASGRFGQVVFDKRGYARKFVSPYNPNTEQQQEVRTALKVTQTALSKMAVANMAEVKQAIKDYLNETDQETTYRWNSWAVGHIIGDNLAGYNQAIDDFKLKDSTVQAEWENIANSLEIPDVIGVNGETVTGGKCAYVVAHGLAGLHSPIPETDSEIDWAYILDA